MGLSQDLIKEFVKTTKDTENNKPDTFLYGTAQVNENGEIFVKFDGSDLLTPVTSTIDVSTEDRVMVLIKNHTANIISNYTSPAVNSRFKDETDKVIADWCHANNKLYIDGGKIYAGTVSAKQINVTDLFAQDITASGTISGLNLIGTTGSFDDIRIKDAIKVFSKTDEEETEIDVIRMAMADSGVTVYVGGNDVTRMILYAEQDITLMQGCTFNANDINCKQLSASYKLLEGGVSLADKYVQPYRPGDSFSTLYNGAGYVTNSSTSVWFTIPIAKPCSAVSNVKITNDNGLIIRQGGKYLYGSSSTTWVKPSSYYARVLENAIRIDATFDNKTNVVSNNDACGVEASIRVTFS